MNKVDVSVQSYNKPESLIFTLLTLHKHCKPHIDTVWINDDQSEKGVIEKYQRLQDSKILFPWKIKVRVNESRVGWWVSFSRNRLPKYASIFFIIKRLTWNFFKNKTIFIDIQDFRYQWAIQSTDKQRLLIIHDDVEFLGNVVNLLDNSMSSLTKPGISGDLGQCWRCPYKVQGCSPSKVLKGIYPSSLWPMTRINESDHKWACRINEWVSMIEVSSAIDIATTDNVFFGNCDDEGDTGAYWFSRLLKKGYSFSDPFIETNINNEYFKHWDGGITGHSAWVDQGNGENKYNPVKLSNRIKKEFNYEV